MNATDERIAALEHAVAELNVLFAAAVTVLDRVNAYHSGRLAELVEQLAAEHPGRTDFADAAETVRALLTLPPDLVPPYFLQPGDPPHPG